jgi:hypothetical protein
MTPATATQPAELSAIIQRLAFLQLHTLHDRIIISREEGMPPCVMVCAHPLHTVHNRYILNHAHRNRQHVSAANTQAINKSNIRTNIKVRNDPVMALLCVQEQELFSLSTQNFASCQLPSCKRGATKTDFPSAFFILNFNFTPKVIVSLISVCRLCRWASEILATSVDAFSN